MSHMSVATANSAAEASAPGRNPAVRVRPRTLRLVLSLALFPIVLFGAFAATTAVDVYVAPSLMPMEHAQFFMLCLTVTFTLLCLWIWRACVSWTAGRYTATAVITIVPLAQVLWWQPLWDAGCAEGVLKTNQGFGMVGLWVWGTVWIWWGWRRLGLHERWRIRMSDSAKRVLLAFGTLPLMVAGFYISGLFLTDRLDSDDYRLQFAADWLGIAVVVVLVGMMLFTPASVSTPCQRVGGCTILLLAAVPAFLLRVCVFWWITEAAVFSLLYFFWATVAISVWVLIWRTTVEWTWRVRLWTSLLAIALCTVAFLSRQVPACDRFVDELRYALPVMAWGGWMVATILIWRFREGRLPTGLAEDLCRCPSCGYSLRGLYRTRCPECGIEPSLDELISSLAGLDDA